MIAEEIGTLSERFPEQNDHRLAVFGVNVLQPEVRLQKFPGRVTEDPRGLSADEGESQGFVRRPADCVVDAVDELAIAAIAGDAQLRDTQLVFATLKLAQLLAV